MYLSTEARKYPTMSTLTLFCYNFWTMLWPVGNITAFGDGKI